MITYAAVPACLHMPPPAAFDSDNGELLFHFHFLLIILSNNRSNKHLINELLVQDMQNRSGVKTGPLSYAMNSASSAITDRPVICLIAHRTRNAQLRNRTTL